MLVFVIRDRQSNPFTQQPPRPPPQHLVHLLSLCFSRPIIVVLFGVSKAIHVYSSGQVDVLFCHFHNCQLWCFHSDGRFKVLWKQHSKSICLLKTASYSSLAGRDERGGKKSINFVINMLVWRHRVQSPCSATCFLSI